MKIKRTIEKVPGGLMVVPLLLGALINTIDQAHLPIIQKFLMTLGSTPTKSGAYEFLQIGSFTQSLFKTGALTLIGLFLFCIGSQMNVKVGGRALKKGLITTISKYGSGVLIGYMWGALSDPITGFLGLSTMAIIAAMTNSNGGMYAALTGQYGNKSDVGGLAILSLNDGPFFTLAALGLFMAGSGEHFPIIAFISVLIPVGLGMLLGNLDNDIREFLKSGESLLIPFFAFALGANMNLMNFFNPEVLLAGLTLGLMTTLITGGTSILMLRLFRERSQIAGAAEASTAGNAVATPAAIAAAAAAAAATGSMSPELAAKYAALVPLATAQVSISCLSTAIFCPLLVIFLYRFQLKKGINSRVEDEKTLIENEELELQKV